MKIAIDARALGWEGIGRYTRNLLLNLAGLNNSHRYIALISKENADVFSALQKHLPKGKVAGFQVDGSYYSWREQVVLPWQLMNVKADLFHFTHFNVPLLFRKPYVVTIHDCTRFNFPGQQRQGLFQQVAYEAVFASACARAEGIITVSKSTREELSRLPIKIKKGVSVIYEGVEDVFQQEVDASVMEKLRMLIGTDQKYILYVGVWMSHKNIERLIKAFAVAMRRVPDLKLVITGKPKRGYIAVSRAVHEYGLRDHVIFPGFVPDYLMPALYQRAVCLVFPSLYEGFGLPALEALASGAPVVASNVTSLPEILGSSAVFVNPENVDSIAGGIEKLLTDDALSRKLVAKGREQAKKFSWETCAQEHVRVYERSIRGK